MIDDLDVRLARIASITSHRELDGLEQAVLGRIAVERAQTGRLFQVGIAAVTGALVIGGLGALEDTAQRRVAAPVETLGAATALAPSTLLGGS